MTTNVDGDSREPTCDQEYIKNKIVKLAFIQISLLIQKEVLLKVAADLLLDDRV